MHLKTFICILLLSISISSLSQSDDVNVLVLSTENTWPEQEQKEILTYYHGNGINFSLMDAVEANWENKDLSEYDIIWIHKNDTLSGEPEKIKAEYFHTLLNYVNNGGSLLLTQHALEFLNTSGLEPVRVEHRQKKSEDNGYGRMLGFHAFRAHPLFDSLNGGAYIWKPPHDTTVSQCGFFEDAIPQNGKVVAVDWDYIFVREHTKLIVEYKHGKGKILGIGAYFNLFEPNINRMHYDVFYQNVFDYLLGKKKSSEEHYWLYGKHNIKPLDFVTMRQILPPMSGKWEIEPSPIALGREKAKDEYCEVAGRRMLVAAYEPGGIFEVWAHPFMAFRDYQARLYIGDSIIHLRRLKPKIEVAPEYVIRTYFIDDNITLKEILTVSQDQPVGVIHYEYEGPEAKLGILYKSNMRLMWPYSGEVLKTLKHGWDPSINATMFEAPEADIVTIIGSNKTPLSKFSGPTNMYAPDVLPGEVLPGEYDAENDTLFEVMAGQLFRLDEKDQLDIIFSAGSEGKQEVVNVFLEVLKDPEMIYKNSQQYYKDLFDNMLSITTPDDNFNKGYKWALAATDRFFVETPGLGTSLVAGYNGTDRGWDGGHKVNGRPGYAWYFGRDAVWSAFAVLDYGDYEGVKDVLNMLIKYQDLNGKIFHELSTSGFVHYDASDATPLFIILAGRYLEYSGDTAYISSAWPAIEKAMKYCESTDTDGDGLIENTNVGHGWVEGGHLFGSHTSFYLASCWAEACNAYSKIGRKLDKENIFIDYTGKYQHIKNLLTNSFFNTETGFVNQGVMQDGSYHQEQSIMPSVGLYFLSDTRWNSKIMLEAYSSHEYTSDWGVRMASIYNKHYHPRGYHSGAVWPLYTGWVSLAEYNNQRPLQGFSHIMNNLDNYNDFSLGYTEEVLNGEKYSPSGVCPHQCWSETMTLQPIIEGMLGCSDMGEPLILSPAIPYHWDNIHVTNIRHQNGSMNWEMHRYPDKTVFLFSGIKDRTRVLFYPAFLHGTEIKEVRFNGGKVSIPAEDPEQNDGIRNLFELWGDSEITVLHSGGISVVPVVEKPAPGEKSLGLRIINDSWEDNNYTILVEGAPGMQYELEVINNFGTPKSVEGASYRESENRLFLEVSFPAMNRGYKKKLLNIHF